MHQRFISISISYLNWINHKKWYKLTTHFLIYNSQRNLAVTKKLFPAKKYYVYKYYLVYYLVVVYYLVHMSDSIKIMRFFYQVVHTGSLFIIVTYTHRSLFISWVIIKKPHMFLCQLIQIQKVLIERQQTKSHIRYLVNTSASRLKFELLHSFDFKIMYHLIRQLNLEYDIKIKYEFRITMFSFSGSFIMNQGL